jgi:hypothetical protein
VISLALLYFCLADSIIVFLAALIFPGKCTFVGDQYSEHVGAGLIGVVTVNFSPFSTSPPDSVFSRSDSRVNPDTFPYGQELRGSCTVAALRNFLAAALGRDVSEFDLRVKMAVAAGTPAGDFTDLRKGLPAGKALIALNAVLSDYGLRATNEQINSYWDLKDSLARSYMGFFLFDTLLDHSNPLLSAHMEMGQYYTLVDENNEQQARVFSADSGNLSPSGGATLIDRGFYDFADSVLPHIINRDHHYQTTSVFVIRRTLK